MSAIKTLLTGGQMVAYYPALARATGGIAPALFLQQVAHWQGKSPDGWVFRTQEELEEELVMSPKVQATARQHLVKLGFLEEKHDGMPRRLYYRPVWEKVEAALQTCQTAGQDSPVGQVKSSPTGEATLKNIEESSSASNEAAADAAPDEKKPKNWFTFYCELANTLNVTICPEDRTRTSKQLKDVVEKEGATEEEMYRVVSKILEASANGYDLSAQKALQKVRGNNVTRLRPEPEPYHRPSIRV